MLLVNIIKIRFLFSRDPNIKTLVPLNKVINELCKHSTGDMPTVHSFDEFYNTIENDVYYRIHFIDNQKQFYQVILLVSGMSLFKRVKI